MALLSTSRSAGSTGHVSDHQQIHSKLNNAYVDVIADGGAVAGDTGDQSSAIIAAYNLTPTGGTLFFPPGNTFRITSAITIAKPITVVGYGATIHQATNATNAFTVTSADVEIRGLTFKGTRTPGSIVYNGSEVAIELTGSSAASPIASSAIYDCEMYGWGFSGVYSLFANNIEWERNYVHDCGYGGLMADCALRGSIHRNRCSTFGPGTSGNAYGIALSRQGTSNETTDPRSSDVTVSRNLVENVTFWEGIDTHGGRRIAVKDNTVRNCWVGIAMSTSVFGANFLAPVDCSVTGNQLDSTVTDGSYPNGIYLTGHSSEYATGVIHGNVLTGYGDQATSGEGAILAYYTKGLSLMGNRCRDSSPGAINCSHDNIGVTVIGNTSQDNWSSTVTTVAGVRFSGASNSGFADGNIVVRGSKSATHVNDGGTNGVYTNGNDITLGTNRLFT